MMEKTTKHQKYIPVKLVLHIYKQANTHLSTNWPHVHFSLACNPVSTPLLKKGGTNTHTSFRRGIYNFKEEAVELHTTVGFFIWTKRYPHHSAHQKTVSKMPQWHIGKQPQTSFWCSYGRKSSSDWTHNREQHVTHQWTRSGWSVTKRRSPHRWQQIH